VATEHDGGGATEALGQLPRQVFSRVTADTIGPEEAPHAGKATRAVRERASGVRVSGVRGETMGRCGHE